MDGPLVLPKIEDTLEDFLTNHTSLRLFRAMLDSNMPWQVAPTHWLGAMWTARHHACYKGFCQDLANAVLWEVNERFFQRKVYIFSVMLPSRTTMGTKFTAGTCFDKLGAQFSCALSNWHLPYISCHSIHTQAFPVQCGFWQCAC